MDRPSLFEIIFNKDDHGKNDESMRGQNFFSRQFSGAVTKRLKRIQSTRLFRMISAISRLISHASTKSYGTMLLTFGIVSSVMYFLRLSADLGIATPIIGIILAVLSLPFLFADRSIPLFLSDFRVTDFIFYELFCMKRHTTETVISIPAFLSAFIGFGIAVVSAFVPLWQIVLCIGVLVCIYVGIESPEFIFLVSLLALPYVRFIPNGEIWLISAVVLAVISFIIKVVYGKRILYIEQYDVFLGVMLLFLLISGIFLKGTASFSGCIRMIILSVGYIIAGNVVANSRLAERSVNAIVLSGVFSAIISIAQTIATVAQKGIEINAEDINFILARQDGIAVFLIASILLSSILAKQSGGITRNAYGFSALILVTALLLSGEVFAVFATMLGLIAYHILKNNLRPGIVLPLMILLPLVILLLPSVILEVIFKFSPSVLSAKDLISLWNSCLGVLSNNLFVGIGIGSESFAEEMAKIGVYGHPDSSNLLIELGLEAGIFALIAFFCIILTRMKHRSLYYLYLRNSQIERLSCVSGACMVGLLAFGMVNYIWSEPATYYFFWCLFGIGSATLRVAKKDYDDKVIYYEESSAFDSSVIDIEIG